MRYELRFVRFDMKNDALPPKLSFFAEEAIVYVVNKMPPFYRKLNRRNAGTDDSSLPHARLLEKSILQIHKVNQSAMVFP